VRNDVVDVIGDPRLQRRVVQQPCQGNDAVQPIRRALPAFGGAAEPLALCDVWLELVQVPA
jgi:hypothetical protein